MVAQLGRLSCRGVLQRSEADDDINYTVLALLARMTRKPRLIGACRCRGAA